MDAKSVKLGTLLRLARESQGISLSTLSLKVRASPSYLSRLEQGERTEPSVRLIKRLAVVLELDEDELFRAAGRLPKDLTRWILQTPGVLGRLRRQMKAAA